jgi:hypothetical protein
MIRPYIRENKITNINMLPPRRPLKGTIIISFYFNCHKESPLFIISGVKRFMQNHDHHLPNIICQEINFLIPFAVDKANHLIENKIGLKHQKYQPDGKREVGRPQCVMPSLAIFMLI